MLEAMRFPTLRLLALFFAFTATMTAAQAAPQAQMPGRPVLTLTPAVVQAGAPELIRVHAPGAQRVSGEWLGHTVEFFEPSESNRAGDWFALAGVDVEAPVGASMLHVTAQTASGAVDLSRTVAIEQAHYRTGSLTVAPKFVSPGPEELKEIAAANEAKEKAFAASAERPLWVGDFVAPVKAQATDSFGTRRMFNGKLASIHKGADFRAAMGTVVRASNSGVVVLARPLYYEGNCVIIDHGMGLFTESMHFSRIDVKEGQHVKAGDVLGLSGATGRVTGPHLHWAVRWQGAMLDPIKLLRLDLGQMP
jgi:biotin carboxyl carrier protein